MNPEIDMSRLPLTLALLLASFPVAAEPAIPPAAIAETFCAARTIGDMSLIEPYLSGALQEAIGTAMARNDLIQQTAPDEKPPLGDGVPWASYPDAPPSCDVDYEAVRTTPAAVPVSYDFADEPGAAWTDTLVLREIDGEWRLDDIRYGGSEQTLTDLLVAAFDLP